MPQGIHRMSAGAERERGEQIDEAAKLEVLRQLQRERTSRLEAGARAQKLISCAISVTKRFRLSTRRPGPSDAASVAASQPP